MFESSEILGFRSVREHGRWFSSAGMRRAACPGLPGTPDGRKPPARFQQLLRGREITAREVQTMAILLLEGSESGVAGANGPFLHPGDDTKGI